MNLDYILKTDSTSRPIQINLRWMHTDIDGFLGNLSDVDTTLNVVHILK